MTAAPLPRVGFAPVLRGALIVLSLAMCAWLTLGLRDAARLDEATRLLAGRTQADPAVAARVERLLGDHEDGRALVLRARAAALAGDRRRAAALAERATVQSPGDAHTWLALALLAAPGDPRGDRARAEVRRLAPPVPEP